MNLVATIPVSGILRLQYGPLPPAREDQVSVYPKLLFGRPDVMIVLDSSRSAASLQLWEFEIMPEDLRLLCVALDAAETDEEPDSFPWRQTYDLLLQYRDRAPSGFRRVLDQFARHGT